MTNLKNNNPHEAFPSTAVILAGGKGTRLGLKDRPKPMVLINDKPLLQIQIEWLARQGLKELYILLNYLPEVVMDELGDGQRWNLKIHYVIEKEPLGTAGALAQLKGQLTQDFFVIYGDLVCEMDLKSLAVFHYEKTSDLTLVTHPNDHPYDSDLVETDDASRVLMFLTKPHKPDLIYKNLVNAAVYLFSEKALQKLETGVFKDLARDVFPELLKELKIFSYKTCEYLKDMGTPDRLEKVKNDINSGKLEKMSLKTPKACVFWDRDGTLINYIDNLTQKSQVQLRVNIAEVVKEFNKKGILNIVVTNQPMLAKGFMRPSELEEIHKYLETLLGNERAWLDEIYFCPHHPDKGFPGEVVELKVACECRKPKTGMLIEAMKQYKLDLNKCFFIGDSVRDLECAQRFQIPFLGFLGGESSKEELEKADFVSEEIIEIKNWIIRKLEEK